MKKAVITGINGQDGSYLAELLLEKGYEVHGTVKRSALENPKQHLWRILPFRDRIHIHVASMESYASLYNILSEVNPHECYHLAAQSFVSYSFEDEFSTINTNLNGVHYLLSALKNRAPSCRFYFAASSEIFGKVEHAPQNEATPYHPRSPYGLSKMAGFELVRNYRESYGLFALSGILYNHESPRRGSEFVTKKISTAAAMIKLNQEKEIRLGNIQARRDWGHAKDYVRAMWLMLQQEEPDDYVIATGETHSVEDFLNLAFDYLGLDFRKYLIVDNELWRPSELVGLRGDSIKALKKLKWSPIISFEEIVREMVDADLEWCKKGNE
jgi:GDPmannose 4,6-dehydratase